MNEEVENMMAEDRDVGGNYKYWSISDFALDSLNRVPYHVRFTPVVVWTEDHLPYKIEDLAWRKYVEKNAEVCFQEGEARWENYQSKTKEKEEKRLHYHAIIVTTEEAMKKWFQRQGYTGSNIKHIAKCVDPEEDYDLTKCFRYVSKDGKCVANKGYPVDRIRAEYWMVDAEVQKYKTSDKKEKKRKFDNWTDEVYANVSHDAMTQTAIGVEIMQYYHKKGKMLPHSYLMGQMTATFVYRNNLQAEYKLSEEDVFRRLYPNLA